MWGRWWMVICLWILFIVFTTLANSETGVKPLRGYINWAVFAVCTVNHWVRLLVPSEASNRSQTTFQGFVLLLCNVCLGVYQITLLWYCYWFSGISGERPGCWRATITERLVKGIAIAFRMVFFNRTVHREENKKILAFTISWANFLKHGRIQCFQPEGSGNVESTNIYGWMS